MTSELTLNILTCQTVSLLPSVSDHAVVMTSMSDFLTTPSNDRRCSRKSFFVYSRMDDQKWAKFANKTDNITRHSSLKDLSTIKHWTQSSLNNSWNIFQDSIIAAAKSCIPVSKTRTTRYKKRPIGLSSVYKNIKTLHRFSKLTRACLEEPTKGPEWSSGYNDFLTIAHSNNLHVTAVNINHSLAHINSVFTDIKLLLAGLYIEAKLKEQEFKIKSIQQALQARIDDYNTDPSRMIDSILNRRRKIITLDKCLDNSKHDKPLLTNDIDVKNEVNRHFQQIAGTTHCDKRIPEEWISTYQPIADINPAIYDQLTSLPSADEWYRILDRLPNDKATGPSSISNEMLKHLGPHSRKYLWLIICGCLQISSIPARWNFAYVYPIPKPKPWEFDLNNTRPITLLECPRKAFVKLLNTRLASVIVQYNILKGTNFAGLPFKSTFDPIHIIDNIKHDAIINKSELWVLLQDMSKAYDRVNVFTLVKAMERLRIPFGFINIIMKLFIPRLNRIFTAHGNTDPYVVVSGIDQGEVISPLLWCIYYDPLLCKIQESPHGYKMSCSWQPDARLPVTQCMSTTIPALAFMDDTLWIAKSANDLSSIISIANSFYSFNDIQVNWPKSELLVNRIQSEPFTIANFNEHYHITARKPNESVRYLGVWISLSDNRTFITKQIHEEIKSAITIMRSKRLTDTQLTYIFNMVILPRVEYKSQLTLPSEKHCDRIIASYVAFLRSKLHFSRKTPSSLFLSHYFYNITPLHQRLVQNLSSALLQMANEPNLLGLTFKMRVRQLQTQEWLHINPLVYWPYNTQRSKDDWLPALLSTLNSLNINLCVPLSSNNLVSGGSTPISDLIKTIYRNHVLDLRKCSVLYAEQLVNCVGNYMFSYKDLIHITHQQTRFVRTPKWFTIIEQYLQPSPDRFITRMFPHNLMYGYTLKQQHLAPGYRSYAVGWIFNLNSFVIG